MTPEHRAAISAARKGKGIGNKNGLGKNLGNKNAFGKTRGQNNGNWKGGVTTLKYKEQLAGRERPTHCEICYLSAKPDFDHSHATGEFRGWLCRRCNLALGMVKDDAALLRRLADYLDLQSPLTRPPVILNLYALQGNHSHKEDSGAQAAS